MALTPEQIYSALNDTRTRLNLAESMPEINDTNVANIGVLPEDQLNQFMGMFNLVLQERYFKVMFDAKDNPFRAFLVDLREDGFGIRDVMQNIIDGVTPMWDNPSDSAIAEDLVSYAGDNFEQKYHLKKFERQFKASVDRREYSKVFTAYGIVAYANNKIANLNTSAEYWLMTTVLDELKGRIQAGELVEKHGFTLNNAQGIKDSIEQIKRVAKGAMMPTRLYNHDGILTKANSKEDLFLITTPEKLERIKAQVLAGTFNMGQLSLDNFTILEAPDSYDLGKVTVDDGGGQSHQEDVLFVVLDRKAFPVGIRTWVMRSFDVPNTLRINNWLSIEGIIGMNGFMTGVAFTGAYGNFLEPVEPAPLNVVPFYMGGMSINSVKDENGNDITPFASPVDEGYYSGVTITSDLADENPVLYPHRKYTYILHTGCVIEGDRESPPTVLKKDGTVTKLSWDRSVHAYTVQDEDFAIYLKTA